MKILLSGFTRGGTIKEILKEYYFDKIILFTSEPFIAKAKEFLKGKKGEIVELNTFDYEPMMLSIGNNVLKNEKEEIIVNITEGHNLMAAAFLSSSQYYGLKTLVVQEGKNKIIILPITSLKETRFLTKSAKEWLVKIKKKNDEGKTELTDISGGVSSQRLTAPLRILRKAEFIEKEKKGNTTKIIVTPLGKLYSMFLTGSK